MKIGIFTLPLVNNYGGNLQCYALLTLLKNMGHEVWHIDNLDPVIGNKQQSIIYLKRFIRKYIFFQRKYVIFIEKKIKREEPIINQYHDRFISEYIKPTTLKLISYNDLKTCQNMAFDAIIVGSDQVWRKPYAKRIQTYFLDFMENSNCKRIAYSVSFGVDYKEFNEEEEIECSKLYKLFSAVSVREYSAINLIENIYCWKGVMPVHTLDPTLLFDSSFYIDLADRVKEPHFNKGLYYYILDSSIEKTSVINSFSSHLHLNANCIYEYIPSSNLADHIYPSIESWIRKFQDANFIITDSYHGCLFSIIFNKPFYVLANNNRGMTRIESVLNTFKLEDRLISSKITVTKELSEKLIDWNNVKQILILKRKYSIDYLEKALKMNKPKISIIIPIFNSEVYLRQCIDSVLNQTFTDFELLLIDDGSTDSSAYICDFYRNKDSRIRVFHTSNNGVCGARNFGIERASGYWIQFIDSDDWVDSNFLNNYTNYLSENYDTLIQSFEENDFRFNSNKNKVISYNTGVYHDISKVFKILENTPNSFNGYIWHRLFKKTIIDKYFIRFNHSIDFDEDSLFWYSYSIYTSNTIFLGALKGYHHRIENTNSLGSKYRDINEYIRILNITKNEYKKLKSNNKSIQLFLEHILFKKVFAWIITDLFTNINNRDFQLYKDITKKFKFKNYINKNDSFQFKIIKLVYKALPLSFSYKVFNLYFKFK